MGPPLTRMGANGPELLVEGVRDVDKQIVLIAHREKDLTHAMRSQVLSKVLWIVQRRGRTKVHRIDDGLADGPMITMKLVTRVSRPAAVGIEAHHEVGALAP